MPDAMATQLAEVFATDIDFHRELRKGDTFSVVYEALTADGEPITWNAAVGRVLAAEFVNDGKTLFGSLVQGRRTARAPTTASTARASVARSSPARWSSRA